MYYHLLEVERIDSLVEEHEKISDALRMNRALWNKDELEREYQDLLSRMRRAPVMLEPDQKFTQAEWRQKAMELLEYAKQTGADKPWQSDPDNPWQ